MSLAFKIAFAAALLTPGNALAGNFYPLGQTSTAITFLDMDTIRSADSKIQAWVNMIFWNPTRLNGIEADYELSLIKLNCELMNYEQGTTIDYSISGVSNRQDAHAVSEDIPPGSAIENAAKIVCSKDPTPKGVQAENIEMVRLTREMKRLKESRSK